MRGRVLIVDDDRAMCDLLVAGLGRAGFVADARTSCAEALGALADEETDAVVADLNMPGMSGVELAARIVDGRGDVPVIVITAFGSLETAIAAIRAGAYDFLTKPFELEALTVALDRAIAHRRLEGEVKRLRTAARGARPWDEVIGESEAMKAALSILDRVADVDSTVLLTGESGTGKEVVARGLHRRGRRADGPFVAVNCAAMPESLLESELFGHAKGAFTDARASHLGLFAQAAGGTLFLDEVSELPLAMQPKLLRVLEERRVRPLGGDREIPVDVRLIAATNRDLEDEVARGQFRSDLFFRLDVIHVELPPLRTRGNDVLLLAQRFLTRFAAAAGKPVDGISVGVARKLLGYPWPGNVRELRNGIERAVALTRSEEILVEDLPDRLREHLPSRVVLSADDPGELVPLEEIERRYILRVLEVLGGNKTSAASVLGIGRKTLYRKLARYGVAADPSGLTDDDE